MKRFVFLILAAASINVQAAPVQTRGLLNSPVPRLFVKCGDTMVYHFNSCEGLKKRLTSGYYGLCSSVGQKFEILKYFACESDPSWKYRPFRIEEVEDGAVAKVLVSEIRRELKTVEAQRNSKVSEFLQQTKYQLLQKFPDHRGL